MHEFRSSSPLLTQDPVHKSLCTYKRKDQCREFLIDVPGTPTTDRNGQSHSRVAVLIIASVVERCCKTTPTDFVYLLIIRCGILKYTILRQAIEYKSINK